MITLAKQSPHWKDAHSDIPIPITDEAEYVKQLLEP